MTREDKRLRKQLLVADAERLLSKYGLSVAVEVRAVGGEDIDEVAYTSLMRDLEELQRQERVSLGLMLLGRLSAEIVHEVRNMANTLQGFAKLALRSQERPERLRTLLDTIQSHAGQFARSTDNFLLLAQPGQQARIDVNRLIEQAVSLHVHSLRSKGILLEAELTSEAPVIDGNFNDLLRVLINLFRNAREAIAGNGRILVATAIRGPHAEIAVSDTGPGVPVALRSRIFDTLFTTKGEQQGTGIGLASSARIVRSIGGTIRVEDTSEGGARFVMQFPLAAEIARA